MRILSLANLLKETLMRDLWTEKKKKKISCRESQKCMKKLNTKSKGKHIGEYECTLTNNDCVEQ